MSDRPAAAVILGPTAVGKTAAAIAFCEHLGGEVVAADSRQIYRGCEIGSAAPTAAERAAVPHRLTSFLDPATAYTVAEYRVAAEACLLDIAARGRLPVVVAGTGLYLSTLVEGWSLTGVAADEALRARLEAASSTELHARLSTVDPPTAARLQVADRKRVIRALEVWELTGQPLSAHHAAAGTRPVPLRYHLVGLTRPRAELYQRIEWRVDAMLAAGWREELEYLLQQGLPANCQALEGLGYRRLRAALAGELTWEEAVALTKQDTRRFARRQLTWFRRLPGVTWLELAATESATATGQRLVDWWTEVSG
ncbi:MAG: tRNA (adenosine(37)-N6)-dimethylallyltransferase MiaA [Fimbriimonadaceae bacterium]|nr:tRNA (adenosine(37)-N6)-dimethylallyltransferase MiaA [Fimbriimonadaceae bacterium]